MRVGGGSGGGSGSGSSDENRRMARLRGGGEDGEFRLAGVEEDEKQDREHIH